MRKEIQKYRLFHRYRILILMIFFIGLWISWFFMGNIHAILTQNPIGIENIEEGRAMLLKQAFTIDIFASSTFRYTMILMPVLVCSMSLLFIWEKKGLFNFSFIRKEKPRKVIIKSLGIHAFVTGCAFYLIFIFFLTIGLLFNESTMTIPRKSFDFIVGYNYSQNNAYLYYVLDGFIKFFAFGFVYSLFSDSVSLLTSKDYLCIIIPVLYYFGMSVIFSSGLQVYALAPVYTQGFTSFENMPLWMAFTPLFVPLAFSVFAIIYSLRRHEKYVS